MERRSIAADIAKLPSLLGATKSRNWIYFQKEAVSRLRSAALFYLTEKLNRNDAHSGVFVREPTARPAGIKDAI